MARPRELVLLASCSSLVLKSLLLLLASFPLPPASSGNGARKGAGGCEGLPVLPLQALCCGLARFFWSRLDLRTGGRGGVPLGQARTMFLGEATFLSGVALQAGVPSPLVSAAQW